MTDTARSIAALQDLVGLSLTTTKGMQNEDLIQAIRDMLLSLGPRQITIPNATPYTVLAANSGKTHIIAEQTSNLTINLPAVADGLTYEFVMGGFATEAQNWIFDTGAAANFYLGGLQFLDSDEPGSGNTLVPVNPDGNSNDVMTIITPQAGTVIKLICDGTNWIVNGIVFSATAPTFAD